jgi:YesN/AraC family two-component response regulator
METANLTAGLKESWLYAALSVMLSAAIFSISYAQLFPTDTKAVVPDEIKKEAETIQKPHEPDNLIIESHQNQIEEENLRIRFEDLIVTEQLFLKQGIRISDIASMLETNRTYVSRLVNNTYNMSFSDYINTLRIDYAEQYLIHHR